MGYRVTKRRNKDGSITRTTTMSRKTLFGNTRVDTYSERIPSRRQRKAQKKAAGKGIPWWIWLIVIVILIIIGASK